jgi:hypothetical protein
MVEIPPAAVWRKQRHGRRQIGASCAMEQELLLPANTGDAAKRAQKKTGRRSVRWSCKKQE